MPTAIPDQAAAMDRMYRLTRHVYDASRRYYLLGRDRLIAEMAIPEGGRVIEVGCGTARNLAKLARRLGDESQVQLFGLDASQQMLDTAAVKLARRGLGGRVTLRQGLAEELSPAVFGQDEPFDVVFFSYCLSMVPTWRAAVDAALRAVRPEGRLYVVDFWDQAELPRWFGGVLRRWLDLFHVHFRPELLEYLHGAAARTGRPIALTPIARRYAYLAELGPVGR